MAHVNMVAVVTSYLNIIQVKTFTNLQFVIHACISNMLFLLSAYTIYYFNQNY